VGCSA